MIHLRAEVGEYDAIGGCRVVGRGMDVERRKGGGEDDDSEALFPSISSSQDGFVRFSIPIRDFRFWIVRR